jgi:hypothetical protein
LPQGEQVWLPIYHCLKDWNPLIRKLQPHATAVRVNDDPSGLHYGALEVEPSAECRARSAECGSTVSVEQAGPEDVGWVERAAEDRIGNRRVSASDDPRVEDAASAWVGARDEVGSPLRVHAASLTHPTTPSDNLEQLEQQALADLRRLLWGPSLWPEIADYNVQQLLAEGMTNLLLKGYTREQRQALVGWQQVMELKQQAALAAREA